MSLKVTVNKNNPVHNPPLYAHPTPRFLNRSFNRLYDLFCCVFLRFLHN